MNTENIPNGYSIDSTGDACTGDDVAFMQDIFTGSFRQPKFAGQKLVTGRIISESYGRESGQHTFTLELSGGEKMRIKGRNLYKNSLHRKPWTDESERCKVLAEKHQRGDSSRANRQFNQSIYA